VQLSPAQRRVLVLCLARGVAKGDRGVSKATLRALEAKGLIHVRVSRKRREIWRATDAGRGLIARSGLEPTFLHRRSEYGYTHSVAHALPHEPEVIRA
jgi:DNA-binding PadR family transcriptional regulator